MNGLRLQIQEQIKMSTKLVAIDSSSSISGIAIFQNAIFKENYHLENKKDLEDPVAEMMKQILNSLNKEKPQIVVIESPVSVKGNPKTQKDLCRITGCVQGWCLEHDCEFNYMFPTEWRKWCILNDNITESTKKLKRKELKKWAVKTVQKIYPDAKIQTDDDAECILLGRGYIKKFEHDFNITIL